MEVDRDWDRHQREIWRLYLIEDNPLKVVMQEMAARHGFSPSKQKWIDKLKQWGCYKNLTKEGWRYVNHQTRKRKLSNSDEGPWVVLSGVRLSREQVRKGIRNHCSGPRLKLPRHRSPSPHLPNGFSLSVYSPPPISGTSWPQNLPWLHFCNGTFRSIISTLETTLHNHPSLSSRPPSATTIQTLSFRDIRPRLTSLIASHKPAGIHNHLTLFMPETEPTSHLIRAESICQQGTQWAALTWVELALFFYSNCLDSPPPPPEAVFTQDGRSRPRDTGWVVRDKHVLELLAFLDTAGVALYELITSDSPTAQALVSRFIASAVRLGQVDILQKLVALSLGAERKTRLLEGLIKDRDDLGEDPIAPIDYALRAGNAKTVDFLVAQGVKFTTARSRTASVHASLDGYGMGTLPIEAVDDLAGLRSLAGEVWDVQKGSFSEAEMVGMLSRMPRTKKKPKKRSGWWIVGERILDRLWEMETGEEGASRLEDPLAALIYAIRYGHRGLMVAVVSRVPDLNASWTFYGQGMRFTALTEAAWAGDLDVCRILLNRGAKPDPVVASSPSALQIAAHLGDVPLATLLIEKGADVNYEFRGSVEMRSEATALGLAIAEQHAPW